MTKDKSKVLYAADSTNPLVFPSFVEWNNNGYSYNIVKFNNKKDAVKWWNNARNYTYFASKTEQVYDINTIFIQKRSEIVKLDGADKLEFKESEE
jgi:hypothetical protein